MNIQYIERGRYSGRIDVPRTLETMSVGESWRINPNLVNMRSIRNCCSNATRNSDKVFAASCPGFSDPFVKITRLR